MDRDPGEEELEVNYMFLPSERSADKDPLEDDTTEVCGADFFPTSVSVSRRRGQLTNRMKFQLEMDEVVAEAVQEWVHVFGRDPREYHAFYLRVQKYIELGLKKQFLKAGKEVEAVWEKYDRFALSLFERWKRSGGNKGGSSGKDKYLGPQSFYLKYLLTGKVFLGGKEVDTKERNVKEKDAAVKELRRKGVEILEMLRPTRKEGTDLRDDLRARLEFFRHAKTFTFSGDIVVMNQVWIEFLEDRLKAPKVKRGKDCEQNVAVLLKNQNPLRLAPNDSGKGINGASEEFSKANQERLRRLRRKQELVERNIEIATVINSDTKKGGKKRKRYVKKEKKAKADRSPEERKRIVAKAIAKVGEEESLDKRGRLELIRRRLEEDTKHEGERRKFECDGASVEELTEFGEKRKKVVLQEFKFELTTEDRVVLASVVKGEEWYFRMVEARRERIARGENDFKWKVYFERQARKATRSEEDVARENQKTRARKKARRLKLTAEERMARLKQNREWRQSLTGKKLSNYRASLVKASKKQYAKLKADPVAYKDYLDKMNLHNLMVKATETPEYKARRLMGYRVNQAKRRLRLQAEGKINVPPEELERKLEELTKSWNEILLVAPKPPRGRQKIDLPSSITTAAVSSAEVVSPPQQLTESGLTTGTEALANVEDDVSFENDDQVEGPVSPSLSTTSLMEEAHDEDLCCEGNEFDKGDPSSPPSSSKLETQSEQPEESKKSALPSMSGSDIPIREFQDVSPNDTEAAEISPSQEVTSVPKEDQIQTCEIFQPQKSVVMAVVTPEAHQVACDECGAVMNKTSLRSHKHRTHYINKIQQNDKSKNLSWQCYECDDKFATTSTLWWHIESSHGSRLTPYQNMKYQRRAPPQPKSSPNKRGSTTKGKEDDQEKFQCHMCANHYKRKDTLDDHIRRAHEGRGFFCDLCPNRGDLQSATKLWRHKVTQHDMPHLPPPSGAIPCEHCGEWILRSYKNHIKKCHPELIDTVQIQSIPRKSTSTTVPVPWMTKTSCPECSIIIRTESLKRHLSRAHDVGPSVKVNCPVCAKSLNKCSLPSHMAGFHPPGGAGFDVLGRFGEKLRCHQCSEVFSWQAFRRHLRQAHPETSEKESSSSLIPCSECGQKYPGRHALIVHFRQAHEYHHLDSLLKNMKLLNSTADNLRSHQCTCYFCKEGPSRFNSKYEWRIHLLRDHREEFERAKEGHSSTLQIKCPLCSQNIAGMEQLLQHVDGVHGGTDLKCGECGDDSVIMSNFEELGKHVKNLHANQRKRKQKQLMSQRKLRKAEKMMRQAIQKVRLRSSPVERKRSSTSSSLSSQSEEEDAPPSPPHHQYNTRRRIKERDNGGKVTQTQRYGSTNPWSSSRVLPTDLRPVSIRLVRLTNDEIQRLTTRSKN